MSNNSFTMDDIVSLSKRRGFIFQSSEIYGGINSCYDYGPLGSELKKNVKDFWWKKMTYRDNIVGLDSAILQSPMVWKASGHLENFTDPLVDCKSCKNRFREDELENPKVCPNCGGELTEPRNFNLMFKTHIGAVEGEGSEIYLRPETAQGVYINFKNVIDTSRMKLPFGIAQIGKSFRNEITPGNFIFRMREFEQMEMQFFIDPEEDEKWFEYWKEERIKYYEELGFKKDYLRFHKHEKLAHYAKAAFDIEFKFPFAKGDGDGFNELEGIHNRTDFDLKNHAALSKKNLMYFDQAKGKKYIPYIIETAAGVDRTVLALLCNAYHDDKENDRIVMKFDPKIAPIKVAVFPLTKKNGHPDMAHKICDDLKKITKSFYDDIGSIGKRYRRQDEAGTPMCITVDQDSIEKNTVTIRDRDTMEQITISADKVIDYVKEKIEY